MRMDPPRGPDAATLLVRALRASAQEAAVAIAVRSIASRPWASATFVGLQHRLALEAAPGDALTGWLAGLPEAQWSIRGHLVADLVVDSVTVAGGQACATLAILTIVDDGPGLARPPTSATAAGSQGE